MNVALRPAAPAFDVERVRAEFPILGQLVRGKKLVFLDSAASAQKPRAVIDAFRDAMETQYANVHRGLHWMSERTTDAYEGTRDVVAGLINARDRTEIVFVRNSTEGINLVANSYGRGVMQPGAAVVISEMEHHSNLVPWQMLRDAHGIELRIVPVTDTGELDMAAFEALLADGRVGLVAITHMSNVLGTYTPAQRIMALAHAHGAKVLLDGSQAVVHRRVDVQALGCDFYVFTGHKLYGPTGIGVLWAKSELLDRMPPWMGGGDMISSVTWERSTWANVPHKFEAGTPAILESVALAAAIRFVQGIGYDAIAAHEASLTAHALDRLAHVEGVRVLGTAPDRGGVVSFTLANAHAHDVATLLDREGIAVRAGNHCAEPLMRRFGVDSTARASFGVYTTHAEIDALADTLDRVRSFFA
ncbi:MAG: cysteine desulfurase [Acetobacteraceae bacterium]|nr:cysteine desulfurase [Acetobacteraceae bacterium]